jgi:orotate phosphoribosyltransferase
MSTHYSFGLEPTKLAKWAKDMAKSLTQKRKPGQSYVLCYSGMSGISLATALALEYAKKDKTLGMMYVRKKGEKSHGCTVESEMRDTKKNVMFVFVDDFVSTGETRNYTINQARKELKEKWSEKNLLTQYGTALQKSMVMQTSKLKELLTSW